MSHLVTHADIRSAAIAIAHPVSRMPPPSDLGSLPLPHGRRF
ncbi:MAG: hypothetical protein AAGE59_32940 [Cyanobacteria bacterium P01_F01_bin.86]